MAIGEELSSAASSVPWTAILVATGAFALLALVAARPILIPWMVIGIRRALRRLFASPKGMRGRARMAAPPLDATPEELAELIRLSHMRQARSLEPQQIFAAARVPSAPAEMVRPAQFERELRR